jgi:hypothetical protein
MLIFDIDRTRDGQSDDKDLENAMIDAVSTSKAWAKRGSTELKLSVAPVIGMITGTRGAMKPLLGEKNYKDDANDVIGKFP